MCSWPRREVSQLGGLQQATVYVSKPFGHRRCQCIDDFWYLRIDSIVFASQLFTLKQALVVLQLGTKFSHFWSWSENDNITITKFTKLIT
jgi:hypothetical protein